MENGTKRAGELAKIFKALGDETRAEILVMLIGRELCVCDIMQHFDKSQPVISHHLKTLKAVGIVTDRREGKWVYYRLNLTLLGYLESFLASARQKGVAPRRCDC